jgi:RNA polymerase sigma factor (sigma-70 family)
MRKPMHNQASHLIADFQAGNTSALSTLYKVYYKPIYHYASRILKDSCYAEDVVANSFTKLWEKRIGFKNLQEIRIFLYVVTRNECIDHLRIKKRRNQIHKQINRESPSQEDKILADLIRSQIVELIIIESASLPEKMKNVFRHLFVEGLTISETAAKTGSSVLTIKSQRAKALEKLRITLSKKGITYTGLFSLLFYFFSRIIH